jgi:prevent-host-death family protein
MATYTLAQAKDQLSRLVDEALAGKPVTITRHGKPVVELLPTQAAPKTMTQADWEWLARRRAALPKLPKTAAEMIREMRDEQ